jgi:hypothetical protein
MNKIIKDCLTERNNDTYEILRLSFWPTLIVFLLLSIIDTCMQHKFNYSGFAAGITTIPISFGIGILSKKHTENDK